MALDPKSAPPKAAPKDATLPQWQPPASALRSPNVSVSGTRSITQADVLAHAHTESALPRPGSLPELLAVGTLVGERYVIEQAISSGGFGAVYRASDRQITNHQVALKLLHVPAATEEARTAALRELTLIASVSHPSIVQFKDYGWYEGRLWFAMPLYRGQTLDKRFGEAAGSMPLSRAEARPLFERVAQGLAAMHEVAIYHHDVKPENIFVADIAGFAGGLPVLLDLGIATKRGEGPKGLTIEYAAPETAAAALGSTEQSIGAAADVFSLALVLRNLLEPETAPAMDRETVALLHRRSTEPVPTFERRDLRYLKPAFARWLSLDPSLRPSAAELATELAILTQPEEQRENRARILRRVVPIVLAAGLIVSVLLLQVRKQKSEIIVQQKQLTVELQESATLRKHSAEQLAAIETTSQALGTQGERLRQAIAIARQLEQQLKTAEERNDGLTRAMRKLTTDRDELGAQQALLTADREGLKKERDSLTAQREGLLRERDGARAERDALAKARDDLETERNVMLTQRNDAIRGRDALQAEKLLLQKQLDDQSAELAAQQRRLEELQKAAQQAPKPALEPWK